jgi:hypothetical protein
MKNLFYVNWLGLHLYVGKNVSSIAITKFAWYGNAMQAGQYFASWAWEWMGTKTDDQEYGADDEQLDDAAETLAAGHGPVQGD